MYKERLYSHEETGGLIGLTYRINLAGTVTAPGVVSLRESTAGRQITLGTDDISAPTASGGTLGLTPAEMNNVTAGTLRVGDANSGNLVVTAPIAQRLGFADDHLIAVQLETDATGWYTGERVGELSFREGKITRVEQWLAARGKTWDDVRSSTFYSDSMNDLSLLEKVDTPVATNPDDTLRALATQRGWRILDLWTT